ncbi:uncharacterized protein PAC_07318 [Phialocephala subalpina]|uniref:Uncharacterized protein n=1 Tax=Phialocephala subalpina TaxID=576137 RepID=A0A1L7WXD9_9HELO|nr:uncharacterized protein PAC_07318 [Phialocephala subalpina]
MSTLHQISFYHECGHTEDCIWVAPGGKPDEILIDALSLVQQIDASFINTELKEKLNKVYFFSDNTAERQWRIDTVRVMTEAGKTSSGNAVEFHYQMKMCCYCDKGLDLGIAPVRLNLWNPDCDTLQYRLGLWKVLVENFTADTWGEQKRQAEIITRMLKRSLAMVTGKNKKDNKNLSEAVQAIEEQERQLQEATNYTMGTRDKFERLYALIKSYFQVNPKFHQAGHISKRWRQEIERWIQARNEWFNKFSVQDSQEILAGVETEDGSHCYSPGWGAKLFTAIDVASGDNCSICTEPLHTNKARKLPFSYFCSTRKQAQKLERYKTIKRAMSTDPATIARIRGLREKKASVNPNLRRGDAQKMAEAISALKLDIFWAPDGPVETEPRDLHLDIAGQEDSTKDEMLSFASFAERRGATKINVYCIEEQRNVGGTSSRLARLRK